MLPARPRLTLGVDSTSRIVGALATQPPPQHRRVGLRHETQRRQQLLLRTVDRNGAVTAVATNGPLARAERCTEPRSGVELAEQLRDDAVDDRIADERRR